MKFSLLEMKIVTGNAYAVMKPSAGNLFGILIISFLVMIFCVGFIQILINKTFHDPRTDFLIGSSVQAVLAFIFPAWLTAFLCIRDPYSYLGLSNSVYIKQFFMAFLLLIVAMPFLNCMIDWNAQLSLPDSMKALEDQLRTWEDTAAEATRSILNVSSLGGLISGILIVGCLTGFAEEMFFRAGILRAFIKIGINVHVGVWITALIFSAIHFQFFGFIPRLLIGALLGYLFAYTGSVWIPAFTHALNNSIVVIEAWRIARGHRIQSIESFGTHGGADLWFAILSLFLSVALLVYLSKHAPESLNSKVYGKIR